jgi:hypothetical protein
MVAMSVNIMVLNQTTPGIMILKYNDTQQRVMLSVIILKYHFARSSYVWHHYAWCCGTHRDLSQAVWQNCLGWRYKVLQLLQLLQLLLMMIVFVQFPFDSIFLVENVAGGAVRTRHFALCFVHADAGNDADGVDGVAANVGVVAVGVDVDVSPPDFAAVVDVPLDLLK